MLRQIDVGEQHVFAPRIRLQELQEDGTSKQNKDGKSNSHCTAAECRGNHKGHRNENNRGYTVEQIRLPKVGDHVPLDNMTLSINVH